MMLSQVTKLEGAKAVKAVPDPLLGSSLLDDGWKYEVPRDTGRWLAGGRSLQLFGSANEKGGREKKNEKEKKGKKRKKEKGKRNNNAQRTASRKSKEKNKESMSIQH